MDTPLGPPPFCSEQKDEEGRVFTVTDHLDTRGLTCPMPAMKTIEKCRDLKPGDVLEVVGDWPGSKLEVPYAATHRSDLEVVRIIESTQPEDDTWWIYVRKIASAKP